jgi:putative peptidoglycan lipid II flippase
MDTETGTNRENSRVAKAAGVVGSATMLSRIFGFIRDMVVAGYFGAGLTTDAFFVAFRIPNLMRRLLGEGSLTVSFVPIFTEYLKKKSFREAGELANVAFTALSALLVIIALMGMLFSPLIVTFMAPGFVKFPQQYELTVFLNRLMFPYVFFICLVALCMGILNSLRHFAIPALSPVVLNIAMIAATLTLRGFFQEPITALAVGVLIGGVLQLAMQWPMLIRMGIRLKPDFRFSHPGLKQIGRLMIPSILGSAVYQINIFIGTILGSLLPRGSVSFLYYADRIVELPLGVFAIAVGTAALPSFSEHVATGDFVKLKNTISFSLRLILFIAIPATVALIVLRVPIISVLFQRGAFDASSTLRTAEALLFYALGLWAFSTIRIIDSAFYSIQDRKSPLKVAFLSIFVNLVGSVILMYPLQHGGLALATSLASAVNVITLAVILRKKIGLFLDKEFYHSLQRTLVASLMMWGALILIPFLMKWDNAASLHSRLAFLSASIVVGLATFLIASCLLKNQELMMLIAAVKRRLPLPGPDKRNQ